MDNDKCIIQGCSCKRHSRKLCKTHYAYLLKYRVFKKFPEGLSDEIINEIYYEYARQSTIKGGIYYEHLTYKRN